MVTVTAKYVFGAMWYWCTILPANSRTEIDSGSACFPVSIHPDGWVPITQQGSLADFAARTLELFRERNALQIAKGFQMVIISD